MPKLLSEDAIAHYRHAGYFFPVPILCAEEVAGFRRRLEAFEAQQGQPIQGGHRNKSHLLFKWLDDLMRHRRILDAIEDLIGPDILCWNTIFWVKEARSPNYVSWHQDLNYWGLDAPDLITAWLAFSPATVASGCMHVLPGSHTEKPLPHDDTFHQDNMLTRGQEIAVEVDESKTVAMALEPGEMSVHNAGIAHASGPNTSDDRRIGISLHYMPTRSRQVVGAWDSAALVRGADRYRHFEPTPVPTCDMDPVSVAFHGKAIAALHDILYQGAEQQTSRMG